MSHRRRRMSPPRDRLGFERCEVRWTLAADFSGEGGFVELTRTYQLTVADSLHVDYFALSHLRSTAAPASFPTTAGLVAPVTLEMAVADGMYATTSSATLRPNIESFRALVSAGVGASFLDAPSLVIGGASNHAHALEGALGNAAILAADISSTPESPKGTVPAEFSSQDTSSSASGALAGRSQMLAAALEGLGREESVRLQPLPSPTRGFNPLTKATGTSFAGPEGGAIDVNLAMSVRPEPPARRDAKAAVRTTFAVESVGHLDLSGSRGESIRRAELARAIVVSSARIQSAGSGHDARSSAPALGSRLIEAGALGPAAAISDRPQSDDSAPPVGDPVVTLSRWSFSATAMAALVWAVSRLQPAKEPVGDRGPDRAGDLGDSPALRRLPRRSA